MIVQGAAARVTVVPTMRGSPPKRRCQSSALTIATWLPDISRAWRGLSPSVGRKLAVRRTPDTQGQRQDGGDRENGAFAERTQ